MKTFAFLAVATDGEVRSDTIRARGLKDAKQQTESLTRVFRFEGRIGEWNEYVEFDPCHPSKKVYIAQRGTGGKWFVFENYPGPKGQCNTLSQYDHKYLAVGDAQNRALFAATSV